MDDMDTSIPGAGGGAMRSDVYSTPDGAIEEVDYGDGTGLRIAYDPEGNETERTQLTGLPIPEPQSETFVEAINAINPDHAQLLMALILDPDRLAILLNLTQGDPQ